MAFGALVLAPPAVAATATAQPPRAELLRAQSEIRAFATSATASPVKSAEVNAVRALTRATATTFWIDPREIVAPPYGASVFADTAGALTDLRAATPLRAAGRLIANADRALAANATAEARGGNRTLLAAARRNLAAGDREAAAGHRPAAARSYAIAWEDAFDALTALVSAQATTVPRAAVAAAAENALGSKRIGLAGPMIANGQPPLTAAGKPEVFFAGSEACPFCAVQRWGMIVALAQFGTFSNLNLIQSTTLEPPPVQTFTFFGSGYESAYVSFVPVEVFSNVPAKLGFRHLQRLAAPQSALIHRYDPPAQVPFIDVDNRFITVRSTVQPQLIAALPWTQIGTSLRHPSTIPAQAVAGEAEVLTAEICESTDGNPSSICSQQVVKDYETALPLLNGRGGGCPAAMDTARTRGRSAAMDTARTRGRSAAWQPARCSTR